MVSEEEIRNDILKLKAKREKIYYKIEKKEKELIKLREEEKQSEYNKDWEKLVGGCFFVESFKVDGHTSNYVHKIISTTPEQLYYEYADLEAEYLADWKDVQHSRGYNKWKKISHEEYEKKVKGFKDLRKFVKHENQEGELK